MNSVILSRKSDNGVETLGTLTATRIGDDSTFTCSTLELPWKDNQRNISCIPKGTYECKIGLFHGKYHFYQVQNVPNRQAIFIHPGNYYTDIEGCILLGVKPADINHDGQIDVTSSLLTVKSFQQFFDNQPFTLIVE